VRYLPVCDEVFVWCYLPVSAGDGTTLPRLWYDEGRAFVYSGAFYGISPNERFLSFGRFFSLFWHNSKKNTKKG
jgi:hypothetical protein